MIVASQFAGRRHRRGSLPAGRVGEPGLSSALWCWLGAEQRAAERTRVAFPLYTDRASARQGVGCHLQGDSNGLERRGPDFLATRSS